MRIFLVVLAVLLMVLPATAGDFKISYNADLGYIVEDFAAGKSEIGNTFDVFGSVDRDYNLESEIAVTYKNTIKVAAHYDALENTWIDRYARLDVYPTGLISNLGGKLNAGAFVRYGEYRLRVGGVDPAEYGMVGLNVNGILE